ncbi:hypothetical protein HDU76_004395 [Blyttiomyces sp. JEL0837]|nr:hypothetical protein HDU76_004395 [Blyttiomyces sp. JEL0837]
MLTDHRQAFEINKNNDNDSNSGNQHRRLIIFDVNETFLRTCKNGMPNDGIPYCDNEHHHDAIEIAIPKVPTYSGLYHFMRHGMGKLFRDIKNLKTNGDDVDVGIWTFATREFAETVLGHVFNEWGLSLERDIEFLWTGEEVVDKPGYGRVKPLEKIWSQFPHKYSPSSTFIVDDSPYKTIMNKPNTVLVPKFDPHVVDAVNVGDHLSTFFHGWVESGDCAQKYLSKVKNPFGLCHHDV